LLAFRDGVLSPQDHEDLHRRIQQNGPIASLLRQINELVGSRELRTPKFTVTGVGDANIVAEYLDDALSSEKVAELERLCLQNADHLCELAHCHQLLAEAMQTHVSVPEALQNLATSLIDPRQRELVRSRLLTRSSSKAHSALRDLEDLPDSENLPAQKPLSESAGSDLESPLIVKSAVAVGGGAIRQGGLDLEATPLASEVPAYLLASQRKRWQIPAAILGLSVLLVVLVWQSVGSLDSLASLWNVASPNQAESDRNTALAPPVKNLVPPHNGLLPEEKQLVPAETIRASDQPPEEKTAQSPAPIAPNTNGATNTNGAPITNGAPNTNGAPETNAPAVPATESTTSDIQPASPDNTAPDGSTPDTPSSDNSEIAALEVEPAVPITGLTLTPSLTGQSRAVIFVVPEEDSLQLLGDQDHPISTGRVIVPPAVRTTMQVGSWLWTTGGPSIVDLEANEQSIGMDSSLLRGLLVGSDANQPLILKTPVGTYRLTAMDPSVWLAVEVAYRPILRGSLSQPGTYAPVLVIVAGYDGLEVPAELARIESIEGEQRTVFRQSAVGLAIIGDQAPTEFSLLNPPRWYSPRSVRLIDQEAAQDYSKAFQNRRVPVSQLISELVRNERPELAALAIQTSLLMGNFRPLVSELLVADRLRAHWSSSIELARQLSAGKPATQTTVQELIQEDFGADATRLFELFQGLGSDQQNTDGLAGLLKGLESESLPMRVLSFHELAQLTGSDHGYLPHAPVKATIQQIRRLQSSGKLSISPVPDPIWERTPQL